MGNNRDLGFDRGRNGKGSANRSNSKKLRDNFPDGLSGEVSGFVRRGQRLVKLYGPAARLTIEQALIPPPYYSIP